MLFFLKYVYVGMFGCQRFRHFHISLYIEITSAARSCNGCKHILSVSMWAYSTVGAPRVLDIFTNPCA